LARAETASARSGKRNIADFAARLTNLVNPDALAATRQKK